MRLFLDTEFNEFNGPLISMALVPEDDCRHAFYEVLECRDPGPWVSVNVMPILGKAPITFQSFQTKLEHYLGMWDEVTIVVDWHEDIVHFCQSLTTGPGARIATPTINFEIRRDLHTVPSETPHNALADATGMLLSARKNTRR